MSQTDRFLELEKELSPYKKILAQASDVILDEGVSKYPIFVIHQQEMDMGVLLIQAGTKFRWSVNASTLEEFVTKKSSFMKKHKNLLQPTKILRYTCVYLS
jgi:hypothetical protein